MATRLQILEFWLDEVNRARQRTTILNLYNGASSGVKDAIFNAFKSDCLATLLERKNQGSAVEDLADADIADFTGTT